MAGHTLLNRTVSPGVTWKPLGKEEEWLLVTDHLVHGYHRGCWGAYGEVAGRGVSLEPRVRRFSIDVIEKTPKFTTKFYRLDTVLPRRELSLYMVVLLARIQGTWVVKIRVSPSGLLHGVVPSAACCGGASWDQAR